MTSAAGDRSEQPQPRHLWAPDVLLERPRIEEAFRRASRHRITVVSGSSGAGKSAAIYAHLRRVHGPTVAYSPYPVAQDLLPFARGLAAELTAISAALALGLGAASAGAARTARPAAALAAWFADHLNAAQATIVLDDLHLVDGSDEIREFVTALIERAPQIRWIVAVRSTATMPVAAWLAADAVDLHIDDALLTFTADEAIELAQNSGVDERRALEVFAVANGHVGRLVLALGTTNSLELAALQFEDSLETSAANFLETLDGERSRSLHALAQLPSLEERSVRNIPYGAEILAGLGAELPFAFRVCEPRFSSSFIAAVRRLSSTDGAKHLQAAHLACTALEQSGRHEEALRIAALNGNSEDVLRLLDAIGFALLSRGYGDIVDAAVRVLGPGERRNNVVALIIEATRESDIGRHDVADAWFSHAIQAAGDDLVRTRVQLLYARDLLRRQRLDCIGTLERIAAEESDADLQASAVASLGAAYATAQRWADSRRCIRTALEHIDEISDVSVRATVYQSAAYAAVSDYDADAAERYAGLSLSLSSEHGYEDVAACALSVLVFVAVNLRDDVPAGLLLLGALEARTSLMGNAFWRRYALLVGVDVHAARGAWHEVTRGEEALSSEEIENDAQHADESLLPARALRLAARGDFAGACHTLAGTAEHQSDTTTRIFRWAEIAMYAAAAGMRAQTLKAMRAARSHLRRLPISRDAANLRGRLNLALAALLMGNVRIAAALLTELTEPVREFPRLNCLHALLVAMLRQRTGAQNHEEILQRLDALNESGFGGMAMMIEAIPSGRLRLQRAA
ncbi:MAG: hypothetical protein M3R44_05275 [Candidatus Eremiobacteraeota bacterium]|nr:hypothetical protein [Candidatus Eremiobacteraeota bacterium]